MRKEYAILMAILIFIGLVSCQKKQEVKVQSHDVYNKWVLEHSTKCDKITAAIIVREALRTPMPALILALIANESSFNTTATNGDAIGLGQIRWKYWGDFLKERDIAESPRDLYNPATNVRAMSAILEKLIKDKESIEAALIAYLGGEKFFGRLARLFLKLFTEVHSGQVLGKTSTDIQVHG